MISYAPKGGRFNWLRSCLSYYLTVSFMHELNSDDNYKRMQFIALYILLVSIFDPFCSGSCSVYTRGGKKKYYDWNCSFMQTTFIYIYTSFVFVIVFSVKYPCETCWLLENNSMTCSVSRDIIWSVQNCQRYTHVHKIVL